MLSLGTLAFAAPWMLALLASLPVIWWLLRLLPPAPRLVRFPAIRLLMGLQQDEETPRRLPLWLLILRLLLATALIAALAKPLLNPAAILEGSGPLVLVIDDGWASAPNWKSRTDQAELLVGRAERAGRSIAIVTTAPAALDEPQPTRGLLRPQDARAYLKALKPKPWPVDRAAAAKIFDALKLDTEVVTVWIADGLMDDGARTLAASLERYGAVEMLLPELDRSAVMLLQPTAGIGDMKVLAERADGSAPLRVMVQATDEQGRAVARVALDFAAGSTKTEAALVVPNEVRNRIARLDIEGMNGAGAAVLIDERFRRRPVGIVGEAGASGNQPLLNEIYYLDKALAPFASLTVADVSSLMQKPTAIVLLPDSATPSPADREQLQRWIDEGGLLVRFAGPRLAGSNDDTLTPVRLRAGDRALGGVMTWDKPAGLAPFDAGSPFSGLNLPKDVIIKQQVLAEPSLELADRIWARLTDGTPLVTAVKRGNGWLVLVHTSANADWSNLSLSGLFVEMLQRMVALSRGVAGDKFEGALKPWRTLDGFGRLGQPPVGAQPIAAGAIADFKPGPITPPGFYGEEGAQQAFNLGGHVGELKQISGLPGSIRYGKIDTGGEIDLVPFVLTAAMALLLLDILLALWLRGLLPNAVRLRRAAAALAMAVLGASLMVPGRGHAQDDMVMKATLDTRLAYVITSNREVDDISRAGLVGLSQILRQRTSVEPAEPIALDLERDDLRLFPFIYWPVTAEQPALSRRAAAAVDQHLKTGGIILLDTRDAHITGGSSGSGPGTQQLKRLLAGIEIPKLIPMPKDHALTKSFYLLSEFPGRWSGGGIWLEAGDGRINDGVTPLVIGANDFAGAWAITARGDTMLPVAPGGHHQRELAFRFGVNLVMYALTGNYKDDQVHLPKILERLVR